ncbi:MAG: ATP synthase F1 subunit epsilon [Gemmataceae bacterium]|nr:ATP synthase F1 subunit epsilon [Gemmataceae bacterium]
MTTHSDAPTRSLQCVVVTPERTVLDEKVEFVALPMADGELGVLPGRAPLIGRLGPGELRTKHDGQVKRLFVDGGFAQVRANVVTVLTPRAQKAEDINTQAARTTIASPRAAGETQDAKAKAQQRARIQLRIAEHLHGGTTTTAAAH